MSETNDVHRAAEIRFQVGLDAGQLPVSIEWTATDAPEEAPRDTKAIMLSVWDPDEKKAMRIDLWTKDMLADDMKLFVFQTLMTTADTFERATGEQERANELRVFANQLAEKMGFARGGEDTEP